MTYAATVYGPKGQPRYVSISLPYVEWIAAEPHYLPVEKADQDRGLVKRQSLLTVAARREMAAKLIESGASWREAAKALGVSHTQVRRDLNGAGKIHAT